MKITVDYNGVNWLLTRSKDTSASKGNSPSIMKVTKKGSLTLNRSFSLKYFKKQPKRLYYQIGWVGEEYYLFVSKKKEPGFYVFSSITNSGCYCGHSNEALRQLGNKKEHTAYVLVPAKVQNAKMRAFKLSPVNE